MKEKWIWIVLLCACIVSFSHSQDDLSAKEIVDRAFKATKAAGIEAVTTLTIMDSKGRERVREIAMVSKLYDDGQTEKRLIRFLAPADVKGTGLLTYDYEKEDDDMWLFMPALRKIRRIVSSEKAKNFMGSEFSYADMTPPSLDDFTYTLLGGSEAEGVECWEIAITPVDDDVADENGFSKRVVHIAKDIFVIRKAVYYDLDGELHKELNVKEIKEIDPQNHKYRFIHMIMTNKQNDRKSVMRVNEIQFNPSVKDDYFTTRYLERF
ncbi:MAG: outer membrane lipoprotein-sorting protein [Candidatus Aminicenantes bacterium]|jgi:hypothetical protein